jgi:hypothetical protein
VIVAALVVLISSNVYPARDAAVVPQMLAGCIFPPDLWLLLLLLAAPIPIKQLQAAGRLAARAACCKR